MKVREVVDRIVAAVDPPPGEKPCDRLIAGDWDNEVTGVLTTFMATVDVIHDAIARGNNLIIPHEPTYFTGLEPTDWLRGDEVYEAKRRLIEDNGINIWRFHDQAHLARPDLIYAGLNKELGWEQYALPKLPCYHIPATTVDELAATLKHKLGVNLVQIVGKRDAPVERVGLMMGGWSLGFPEQAPMELMRTENMDVAVCGEILEWTLCAYARDAGQLGLNKAIIIVGHNRSEEAGMKHLPDWLRPLLPGVPVEFSEAGEPFVYV
jgi:putative NIF3 family GTP cyclohydrolase 1 type 2